MKKTILLQTLLFTLLASQFSFSQPKTIAERLKWWQEARFGMFIHFGIYAIHGKGEWMRHDEKVSNEQYQPYVESFNPVDYNPKEWAKLAKEAGMKYAVMTAKHHDGFCLWDSKLTDYKSTNFSCKKDLIKEYTEAYRAEGLKVGIYYSLIDWHHPDYPHYADEHHPMRGNEAFKNAKHDWDNYLKYMHGQVKELLSNYGKIDILWLDFSYGEMRGEKWKAKELVDMIRKLQPDIIINNRLGGDGVVQGAVQYGDFETPEQGVPETAPTDENGNIKPWETCLTHNNHWGYHNADNNFKSAEVVIHTLVNCVSKGGNLLLNVGPDAKGKIPQGSVEVLKEVGQWMRDNGASIYGCGVAKDFPRTEYARFTQKGNKVYMHKMYPTVGFIRLKDFQNKFNYIRFLADGTDAPYDKRFWGIPESQGFIFLNCKRPVWETFSWPNKINTVLEIELR